MGPQTNRNLLTEISSKAEQERNITLQLPNYYHMGPSRVILHAEVLSLIKWRFSSLHTASALLSGTMYTCMGSDTRNPSGSEQIWASSCFCLWSARFPLQLGACSKETLTAASAGRSAAVISAQCYASPTWASGEQLLVWAVLVSGYRLPSPHSPTPSLGELRVMSGAAPSCAVRTGPGQRLAGHLTFFAQGTCQLE